jgi:hypothetical protein
MKITPLPILFFAFTCLILACNTNKQRTIIGKSPNNCTSPSDAIIKFQKSNEMDVVNAIIRYATSRDIEFENSEEEEIENWINNSVFSSKRGDAQIVEWNINDEDICFIQQVTVGKASDSSKIGKSVEIKICNTVLTKDLSAGNTWTFDSKNFSITLQYCFDVLEHVKRVGYYEVREENGRFERSLKTDLQKYYTSVNVHLQFYDKRSNTELTKFILTDNGFLYTDAPIME